MRMSRRMAMSQQRKVYTCYHILPIQKHPLEWYYSDDCIFDVYHGTFSAASYTYANDYANAQSMVGKFIWFTNDESYYAYYCKELLTINGVLYFYLEQYATHPSNMSAGGEYLIPASKSMYTWHKYVYTPPLYTWGKYNVVPISTEAVTHTNSTDGYNVNLTFTTIVYYSSNYTISSSGKLVLSNPSSKRAADIQESDLTNKYWRVGTSTSSPLCYSLSKITAQGTTAIMNTNTIVVVETTPESRGTFIERVSSETPNVYPTDGTLDNYWYTYASGTTGGAGTFDNFVSSMDRNAYPDNGLQDGYWYMYQN